MEKKDESIAVTFLDNPHAPAVFADAAAGFFITAGNVHITLESARVNHVTTPGPVNRVVIARLVMPISGAQGLAAGLYDFLACSIYTTSSGGA